MVGSGVVFCEVVSIVFSSGFPVDMELFLVHAVTDPVEAHVNGFRPLEFDVVICDACSGRVIDLDGSGWLWVAHFMEDGTYDNSFFHVGEQAGCVGFGR